MSRKRAKTTFEVGGERYTLVKPTPALLKQAKSVYAAERDSGVAQGLTALDSLHDRVVQFDLWREAQRHHFAEDLDLLRRWDGGGHERGDFIRRTAERVRALRLAGRLYEQGTAEEAGLEARRAFLVAATVLHGRPRRPVFRDAADFKARLEAGDPVALAALRAVVEAEEGLRVWAAWP